MPHISLFFCDIVGTIRKDQKENCHTETIFFLDNLELLRLISESEHLFFSLVSSEKEDVVRKEKELLENYNLYPNIIFQKQFFDNGYIEEEKIVYTDLQGKISQIINHANELTKYYHINNIYYADDTYLYHEMLDEILSCDILSKPMTFVSFCPENEIYDLNNRILYHIKEKYGHKGEKLLLKRKVNC